MLNYLFQMKDIYIFFSVQLQGRLKISFLYLCTEFWSRPLISCIGAINREIKAYFSENQKKKYCIKSRQIFEKKKNRLLKETLSSIFVQNFKTVVLFVCFPLMKGCAMFFFPRTSVAIFLHLLVLFFKVISNQLLFV